jgi:uncharacterized protein (TIGR02147 family)
MGQKLNIYQFDDYRELIGALISQRRKEKKIFSYRWFSQRAGLSAPNFLNLVVKGKRHLSTDSVEKVIEIFQLNREEAEFFRHLVHFNKAKTLSEKEHFALQLIKLRKFQKEFPLSRDQFDYYAKWQHIPIRETLNLCQPPRTEAEISELLIPGVSCGDVRAALEKLQTLDMIAPDQQGWKVRQESVTTGHKFSSYGVVQFHKKMLALAAESLDRFPSNEREISSVTIGCSQETFARIKKLIEDFRSQLMTIAEEDRNKERIYQIGLQLFPLTRRPGDER